MKISQKLENACRVLLQLAERYDGETVTRLDALAQREDVSSSFLVQIFNDLRRAGIVDSRRGKQGGYLLARDPANISLRDIAEALEPNLLQKSFSSNGESGTAIAAAWEQVSEDLNSQLAAISLAKLKDDGTPMFYI